MSQASIAVVNSKRFVQATRDSGYRNLASALSELVDNSLQASASYISIIVHDGKEDASQPYIAVQDNGCGMSQGQLSHALQFGGSNRFDDRTGMGRFGMGLPNSSFSQARRVDVYTWRNPKYVWHSYLDLDELLTATQPQLLPPRLKRLPMSFRHDMSRTGTLVIWQNLDRSKPSNWKTLVTRLERRLGQAFRYFLWNGRRICINGTPVRPYDPLFLSQATRVPWVQADQYGDVLKYEIGLQNGQKSTVEVRFSELPVCELGPQSNQEKRLAGITNGAGVSIVRAEREIDCGWFLMDKRRENYDDWWRCEIRFSPELDELFGVTHIKQGIRPTETLCSIMTHELGTIARTLNRRVRLAHIALASQQTAQAAAIIASQKDILLRPLPFPQEPVMPTVSHEKCQYRITAEKIDARVFSQSQLRDGQVTVVLNTMHEFFRNIYHPLVNADYPQSQQHRKHLELLLFALGRSLHLERSQQEQITINAFMTEWSRAIAAFCGGAS